MARIAMTRCWRMAPPKVLATGRTPEVLRTWIDAAHDALTITRQCELRESSRSGAYSTPAAETAANVALMTRIDRQYLETPFYCGWRLSGAFSAADPSVFVEDSTSMRCYNKVPAALRIAPDGGGAGGQSPARRFRATAGRASHPSCSVSGRSAAKRSQDFKRSRSRRRPSYGSRAHKTLARGRYVLPRVGDRPARPSQGLAGLPCEPIMPPFHRPTIGGHITFTLEEAARSEPLR